MFRYLICCLAALAMAGDAMAQYATICENGVCRVVPMAAPVRRVVSQVWSPRVVALPTIPAAVESMAILSDVEIASAVAAAVASSRANVQGMAGADDREIGRRLVLRLQLKRLQRQGVYAGPVRQILADEEKFELVYQGLRERYDAGGDGTYMGTLQDFLQFLIDNQDEIVRLIQQIINLFSQPAAMSVGPAWSIADGGGYYAGGSYVISGGMVGGGCGCDCPNCTCDGMSSGAWFGTDSPPMTVGQMSALPLRARLFSRWSLRRQGRMQSIVNFAGSGVNNRGLANFLPRAWFNLR